MSIETTTADPPDESLTLPRQRATSPSTALLAIADVRVRRVLTEELAYRGPWTFLQASTLADAAAAAADHGPGELAVLDAALDEEADIAELVRFVRMLRRSGWEHVMTVGNDARFDRIGAALTAGARGHLMTTEPGSAADTSPPARLDADPNVRSTRVLDAGGGERILSQREVEVLRLTAEGLGNTEIGNVLGLSALTIKSHLARITHRLHAKDRAHLVLLALRAGAIR
jgi:DNA-binding NarL/FixJ family response regulator